MNNNTVTRSILIEGRTWFDKEGGNTYWSSRIWVDGQVVKAIDMSYGYDLAFRHESLKWLDQNGYFDRLIERVETRYYKDPTVALRNLGIDVYATESQVTKKNLWTEADA